MNKYIKFLFFLIISLTIILSSYIIYDASKELRIKTVYTSLNSSISNYFSNMVSSTFTSNTFSTSIANVDENISSINENIVSYDSSNSYLDITSYMGYDVEALLEIPKIDLSTTVLSTYSNESLEVSPAKFYGTNPNTIRKLCYCRS